MNIIHSLSLSQKQLKEIRYITELCHQADGCTLSCPEDADAFWLLYEDGQNEKHSIPAAFFAVYKVNGSCWECYAFTRPDGRGRGYFSALLEDVCTYSQEDGDPDLCFAADHRCKDVLPILSHLGAVFWYDEYIMERPLRPAGGGKAEKPGDRILNRSKDGCPDYSFKLVKRGLEWEVTDPQASCRLTLCGDIAFLYELEIVPFLRGQGVGVRFMNEIITMLEAHGCKLLRLQVSGTNEAAMGLYKKTGFCITQTLSYYLY